MTTNAKTFRLFISSTFNDFKSERQVLHEKVFPVIDNYCIERGYTFQPVDLRWGVNDEAQLDQKTLELCLNEVRACKHYPYPNFLIMLGNRYGWVSLPYAIEKDEFESILKLHADNKDAISMLKEWYIEDTNHLMLNDSSHAYVIKERDPKGAYKEWKEWEKIENQLRDLLQKAAKKLFKENTAQYNKYFMSATEAEVEEGIFKYLQPTSSQTSLEKKFKGISEIDKDYVYGFVRTIKDHEKADLKKEPAKSFIDKEQMNVTKFRQELQYTLEASNIHKATVTLTDDKDNPVADDSYLKEFERFMIEKLENAVDKQIQESQEISELEQERSEQLRFKNLKTETFFGREDELKAVQDYIDNPTKQPFMVHGISGIGKSSFIAQAIDQTEKPMTHRVAYRFIGATASSSNIRTLLESLIIDLVDQGVLELPEVFEEDNNKFNEQMKELLSNIERPTMIILDALDQLQHKDYLQWLPLELPSNLKIILSMLDQEGYEHYYKLLEKKIDQTNQCEILPLDEKAGRKTLEALLEKEERSLTKEQFEYVIEQYKKSDSSPLYLNIAFEKIKTWKSTETTETLSVGIQEIIKEFIDNLTEKFHHDRTIVHKVLGLISASKYGLSEKEILDLLSRDEEILKSLENFTDLTLEIDGEKVRRFPISIWARLHEQLKPFINEKLIDGQNLINFFHRQIEEAVKDYIYEPNKHTLHTELEAYFLTLQDKEKLWDKRYYNHHMLDEVPYQLYYAGDTERLKEILFDLEFAGSIYDHHKQDGFREIMGKAIDLEGITPDKIYPWESFYREKEYLIIKMDEVMWRPHQSLFQLAYEDGNNSPLTQQAEKLLEDNKIDFVWMKRKNRHKELTRTGLLKVLQGHSDTVSDVKVLTDGRLLSCSDDNTLRLWNNEGKPLTVLEGHINLIWGVKILKDGRILSYSMDSTLRLWNSEGEFLAVLEGHTDYVYDSEIINDGRILSYSKDNTLRLWNNEGKPLAVLEGHTDAVNGAEILKDGRILSYSKDNTLRLWNNEGKPLAVLEGHTDYVRGVQILKDGRILSYSNDKTLRLWNREGESLTVLEGHTDAVNGAEILKDGRILSYSKDNTLRLWNNEGKPLAVLEGHTDAVSDVKVMNDGRILSYSNTFFSLDKTLRLWNNEGKPLAVLEGHTDYVRGVQILKDGRILSYSNDKTLRLWNREGESLTVLEGHTDTVNGAEILKDGRILSYSNDKTLRLWKSEGEPLAVLEVHTDAVLDVKVMDDGRILSYSNTFLSLDNTLRILNSHGELLAMLEGHTDYVRGVQILKDGRILSYSNDKTLRLWNREGESLTVLEGHTDAVNGAEILKDGRILSWENHTLRLWSSRGKPLAVLEGHTDYINGAETLNDGKILTWASNTIRLWNNREFHRGRVKALAVLEGHRAPLNGVKILSDGRILSYSMDSTLRLWNPQGELLSVLIEHSGPVRDVKILSDGRILSCSEDRDLRLWSSEGEPLAVLEGHTDTVYGAKTLDDGRILSYSEDNTLRLWSSEGIQLNVLYLTSNGIKFDDIQQETMTYKNGKYLFLYDYWDGSKATTLQNIVQKSEALLYEDGI